MNAMKSGITMLLVVLALALSGCAAIPLSLASGAFSGGAGAAVNAGTEYASGGVVYRTFTLPLDELRLALGDALARMEIAVVRDEVVGDERRIEAHAHERVIKLRLEPVSRTVTRLRLVVSEKPFKKDRATASEIVTQTERAVVECVPSDALLAMRAEPTHRALRASLVRAKCRASKRRLRVAVRVAAAREPRPRGLNDVLRTRAHGVVAARFAVISSLSGPSPPPRICARATSAVPLTTSPGRSESRVCRKRECVQAC